MNQAVSKCARFFKTLLHLSEKNQQQQKEVRQLVRGVLFGRFSPEEFTVRLQKSLNSQAQQNLLPFLQSTLPALRAAVNDGELVIESIGTSAEYWAEAESERNPASVPLTQPSQETPQNAKIEELMLEQEVEHVMCSSTSRVISGPLVPSNFHYTFLDAQALLNRIREKFTECSEMDDDILILIANAAEHKLRSLLAKLSIITDHRLEPLRLNPSYKQLDDPRKQLHSVEVVERRVFERRETLEREALIKISKSKGKDKDTIERVKQIQKADKEAALNREANEAAFAALGGIRGTKRPTSGTQHALNSRLTVPGYKPRIKRITNRDMMLTFCKDSYASSSNVYYKLCYSDENKNFN